jgi:isoquinoline 1-oxidoreductase beta subunit
MKNIKGKVVVITGESSGLGEATARMLSAEGALINLGIVVNPDNVKNQIEGAVIMALSAATKPGITFKNGIVEQNNFYDNPVPRMSEAFSIEVHIIADGGRMKGVGEPGIPPFAPALANAIFAATGKRFRKMPFELKSDSFI